MPRKAASWPVWALWGPLVPEGHQQRRHHGKGRARGKGRAVSFHTCQWSPLYLEKQVPRKQLIKGGGANSARGACGVVLLGCEAGPAPVQPRSAQRVCPRGRPLLWAAAASSRAREPPEAAWPPATAAGKRPDVTCTAAGAGGGSVSPPAPPPWAPPGRP